MSFLRLWYTRVNNFYKRYSIWSTKVTAKKTKSDKPCPNQMDIITGKEKRELLALTKTDDPYYVQPIIRQKLSTEQNPNQVPSVNDHRMIGCICNDDTNVLMFQWIYAGKPQRCTCGHWFQLVRKELLVK